jgi:acyl carrier protein
MTQVVPDTQQVITVDDAIAVVRNVVEKKGGTSTAIDASTRFDQLDFDSLDVAELFVELEERTGRSLDPESGERIETVGELTRLRPL